MGFWSSKSKSTTTTTPNTPQWYKDMLESNMTRANTVANRSADEAIAGFNTDQTNSFDLVRQMLGQGQGNFDQANQTLSGLLNSNTSTDYQKYMNPYINDVIQQQKNEAVRDADKQRLQLQSQQQNAGSWGGSRSGVALGELNRNLDTQLNNITSTGLNNAYNQAQNLSMQNRNQQLSAANQSVNAALQNQSYNLNDANALNKVGTAQQQLEQARLDLPQSQTSWLSGLLGNINPSGIYGTTDTTVTPTSGWGKDLLGMGLSAAALAGTGGMSGLASGLGSLGGLFSSGTGMTTAASPSLSPLGNSQMALMFSGAGLPSANGAYAEGGQVQGYAEGGSVVNDSLFTEMFKKAGLRSTHDSVWDFYKNRSGNPLIKILDAVSGEQLTDKDWKPETNLGKYTRGAINVANTGTGIIPNLVAGLFQHLLANPDDEKKKAEQAALKAQQERQKVSQQTGKTVPAGQGEPASGDTESLPKQDPVSSVIEETKQAASDKPTSISDLIQYMREQNKPKKEESKVNMPLLMAGLGMMASKNPSFMGAIGEGGLTGAQEYTKEQTAAKEREALHQKALNEMLVNLQKNQANQEIARQKADDYHTNTVTNRMNAEANLKRDAIRDATLKTLQAQVNSANRALLSATLASDKEKYRKDAQDAQTKINQILANSYSSNQPFGSGTMLQPPVDEQDSGDTGVKDVPFVTMK